LLLAAAVFEVVDIFMSYFDSFKCN